MANAKPVNSKVKEEAKPIEVVSLTGESDESLIAKAKEIAEREVPADILDEQVNQIGQLKAYGKVKRVVESPYDVLNRKGDIVREGIAIRIDH